ncbi:unnamed protein product [Lota lota]
MPPLPLDERIVLLQRPKNLSLCEASSSPSPGLPRYPSRPPPPLPPSCANGGFFHASSYLQPPHLSPYSCGSLSLECRRRLWRAPKLQPDPPVVLVSSSSPLVTAGYDPSHRHSNGTVTLGPRLPSHTHAVDITVSLEAGAGNGEGHSPRRGGSLKGGKGGKRVSLHPDRDAERKAAGGEQRGQRQNHGGGLQFVPAQYQQHSIPRREKEKADGAPGFLPRGDRETSLGGSRKSNKLGTAHQNPSSLLPGLQHPVALPHASVLNPSYPASSPPLNPSSFRSASAGQDHRRPRPPILHGLPLSPGSSGVGGFPSPDHTCTVDLSYPFNCGCWELVRRKGFGRGCQGGGGGGGGGGSPSSSFSCVQTAAGRAGRAGGSGAAGRAMGLRSLGGCLSTTSNTSSSNSTASDCRPSLLKPLACVSCSSEAGPFESPAMLRKRLVGGCLPIHSCVTGCDPKASQTASSTCSYCSSDPIVVTFNPRRSKPPGRGVGGAAHPHPQAGVFPQSDDDDYSVRTIWPEELARKMSHSHSQQNSHGGAGMGPVGPSCVSRGGQNGTAGTTPGGGGGGGMALLDCQNLREFSHAHLTDHAGRRRLWQGKMAALDFMGGGGGGGGSSGAEDGRSSLKRLLNKDGDAAGGAGDAGEYDDMAYRRRSPSPPPSPVSFSPPQSNPGTLIVKPRPRQRDNREREGGHSLPSAQSLHLVLDSLNRDQDEENRRLHLSLPLSSSLPASLSDEGAVTPDAENAVVSAVLPFLFLGNERDAQDLDLLLRLNVGFVVNVTTHLPLYHVTTGLVRYKRLPATDNSRQNLQQYFEEAFEFIEEAHQTGKGVLVHCQAGVSRSATVVIAYLMKHTLMTMTDAYKYVRGRRPVVSPNLNFMGQLLEFERDLNSGVTPRILTPKLSGLETQV